MALLGPIVLLIVLLPVLLACALFAGALWAIAQLLLELWSARGERSARRAAPCPAVRTTAEPAVEVGPAP